MTGSTGNWVNERGEDNVTVTAYVPASGSPYGLRFESSAVSDQGQFSLEPEDMTPGCSYSPTVVTCAPSTPINITVFAGFGSNDEIDIVNIGRSVSTFFLGGDGNDTLTGEQFTEDFMVDGSGTDTLFGRGLDDSLINARGAGDRLYGQGGDDLFFSAQVCEGDISDVIDCGAPGSPKDYARVDLDNLDANTQNCEKIDPQPDRYGE